MREAFLDDVGGLSGDGFFFFFSSFFREKSINFSLIWEHLDAVSFPLIDSSIENVARLKLAGSLPYSGFGFRAASYFVKKKTSTELQSFGSISHLLAKRPQSVSDGY